MVLYRNSYLDDIIEKYNFVTGIPETRCLKILCKFSFVTKKYVSSQIHNTSPFTTNECFILTNHIRSHIKASGHKLTLITSKKNFPIVQTGLARLGTNNSLLSTELVSFTVVSMLTSFTASARAFHCLFLELLCPPATCILPV